MKGAVADEAAEGGGCFAGFLWLILQGFEEHFPIRKFPHAEDRCVSFLSALAVIGIAAAFAVFTPVDASACGFRIDHEPYFPRHEILLCKQIPNIIVDVGDEAMADLGNLRGSVCREIEREAEEDISILLEFRLVCFLARLESLFADAALFPAIFECVELRSYLAVWAEDVTRCVA